MSAFTSIVSPEAALLLTDGATYDDQGIVRKIASKVFTSRSVPLAVTTRGHADGGERIARAICDLADEIGAAPVIDHLQEAANQFWDSFGTFFDDESIVQVLVAAHLPGRGGVHRSFSTVKHVAGHNEPAYHVYEPPAIFATGPFTDTRHLIAGGIPYKEPGESMVAYVRKNGADMMEVMRKRLDGGLMPDLTFYSIGGRCDLTVIDATGARTETLRVWDDKIGQPVDPFKLSSTVVGMNSPKAMNRQQRRALKRAQAS